MDINLPFGAYYPRDDSKFIDPLYVPYQYYPLHFDPKTSSVDENNICYIPINTWEHTFNPMMVHSDQIRRGWDQTFLNINPQDTCPGGFEKAVDNDGNELCVRVKEEEQQSNFYTKNQFGVANQYPNGYSVSERYGPNNKIQKDDMPAFKGYSVNPWTGNFVRYYNLKTNKDFGKYGTVPVRYSYLGI